MVPPLVAYEPRGSNIALVKTLAVAAVAISCLHFGFCFVLPIGAQRAAHVVRFVELTVFIAGDISLVGSRIDQFSFSGSSLSHHYASILSGPEGIHSSKAR